MPRTDGFSARNVAIHNFGTGMVLLESASENSNKLLLV